MPSLDAFVRKIQDLMKEMSIGILRIEKADLENGTLVLTVAEDLDCSGLPELDYEICVYDEGFISGLLESYTGKKFTVKEIDCWCTGDRTCRFRAEVAK
jgi:predicted hydrocarbon binding protein